mgnify:CR=1 FL=1
MSTRNVPLVESDDPKIRELATLDQKFVTDVANMSPAVASYVRRHPWLSPESMKKWRVGGLPMDGGSDKRGLSLRGNVIYPLLSEDGQVLAWIGRDPKYEEKERDFARLSPAERTGEAPPMKHRFPKGIHRGLELFGQQASRLKEPGYRESIASHGIIVVEGFNDVIGLDNIGVPAVAVMSNRMTEMQGDKVALWAKQLAGGKVTLMFDCDRSRRVHSQAHDQRGRESGRNSAAHRDAGQQARRAPRCVRQDDRQRHATSVGRRDGESHREAARDSQV